MTKILVIVLLALLAFFQYQLWGTNGASKTFALRTTVTEQKKQNDLLQKHNDNLQADIIALRKNNSAIEDHARNDLGMIRKGESFYQLVKDPNSTATPSGQPTHSQ